MLLRRELINHEWLVQFRLSCGNGPLAPENNSIVWARVVGGVAGEEVWNITIGALFIGVILARACLPAAVVINVVLPR